MGNCKHTKQSVVNIARVPRDHLLLDRSPNIGPLISRWELDKFKNYWNKSFRTSKILTLLYEQFSNLLISQRDMSGPRLGALSNNRWSGGTSYDHVTTYWTLTPDESIVRWQAMIKCFFVQFDLSQNQKKKHAISWLEGERLMMLDPRVHNSLYYTATSPKKPPRYCTQRDWTWIVGVCHSCVKFSPAAERTWTAAVWPAASAIVRCVYRNQLVFFLVKHNANFFFIKQDWQTEGSWGPISLLSAPARIVNWTPPKQHTIRIQSMNIQIQISILS